MDVNKLIKNKFLLAHLEYVKDTESPLLMHVWAAIASAGACMARHVYLETGIKKSYANNYCLLVGPPGTRKNAAINFATNLVRDCTDIKFAPDDTGGQRQGLIKALQNADINKIKSEADNIFNFGLDFGKEICSETDMENIGNFKLNLQKNDCDKHALFVCATEFGSFLGNSAIEMTRFLIKMWDCESYKYTLKSEEIWIEDPCINILGGTTSSDIAALLPQEAIGQGFMSRIILVFAAKRHRHLPPSKSFLNKDKEDELKDVYSYLAKEAKGGMTKAPCAIAFEDKIYMQSITIADTRFIHYSERRADHLSKTAMILAATDKRMTIYETDFLQAHELLLETEKYMPSALGEYGLSSLALGRQKMVEFIQHANGPVSSELLWIMLRKDMRILDFRNCISELIDAKKIVEVQTSNGQALVFNEIDNLTLNLMKKI